VTTLERITRSEDETRALARRLGAMLRPGDVVTLAGPLGAGKTCFVRGLAEGLGLDPDRVSSPTFVVCQEYSAAGEGGGEDDGTSTDLVHVDGYRLEGPDDLETIGWDEIVAARDAVIAVEWPERFGAALPERRIRVEIAHVDETSRRIEMTAEGALAGTLGAADGARLTPCPICRTPASPDDSTYPFCSDRCRLVDLGHWLDERYRV
jgi:tRNA threonylcarbamoyladenosine biosynthesis protein TsaE